MKLRYFAWVRERIGTSDEDIILPPTIETIAGLIAFLKARGENYAHAFEDAGTIRASIDRTHVKHDAAILGAKEIAFFPPMTGG